MNKKIIEGRGGKLGGEYTRKNVLEIFEPFGIQKFHGALNLPNDFYRLFFSLLFYSGGKRGTAVGVGAEVVLRIQIHEIF
jgi:hypothetical protein